MYHVVLFDMFINSVLIRMRLIFSAIEIYSKFCKHVTVERIAVVISCGFDDTSHCILETGLQSLRGFASSPFFLDFIFLSF